MAKGADVTGSVDDEGLVAYRCVKIAQHLKWSYSWEELHRCVDESDVRAKSMIAVDSRNIPWDQNSCSPEYRYSRKNTHSMAIPYAQEQGKQDRHMVTYVPLRILLGRFSACGTMRFASLL